MGLQYFQPSQSQEAPVIAQMTPTNAATLTLGEPVQRNSGDPELIEAHAGGATVTGIVGVALGAVTSGVPAFGSTVPVALATRNVLMLGQIWDVSEGVVATASLATHEGVQFGMIEQSNRWYVDEEDVTHVVLRVVKVLPEINAVLFRWIGSAIEGA
jgi:hypothetical protein